MSLTPSRDFTLAHSYLQELAQLINHLDVNRVTALADRLRHCREQDGSALIAGNGGSAANAAHLSLHLKEADLPAVDLAAEVPVLTAYANDVSYGEALALHFKNLVSVDDVLVVISGSGNSENILAVLEAAREVETPTLGLLGFGGGKAAELCDEAVIVPSFSYGFTEDSHSSIIHVLRELLLEQLPHNGA